MRKTLSANKTRLGLFIVFQYSIFITHLYKDCKTSRGFDVNLCANNDEEPVRKENCMLIRNFVSYMLISILHKVANIIIEKSINGIKNYDAAILV